MIKKFDLNLSFYVILLVCDFGVRYFYSLLYKS